MGPSFWTQRNMVNIKSSLNVVFFLDQNKLILKRKNILLIHSRLCSHINGVEINYILSLALLRDSHCI